MGNRVVEVPHSVTVRSVAGFKEQLSAAFDADGEIVLDLAALSELDLSFVQLVQSARIDLTRNNRAVRLAQPTGDAVAALLGRAGFLTDPDPADVDFWFHGDLPR